MSDSATMPAAALRRTDLPKLSLGTKTAATLLAIVAAVVLPQLFHVIGAFSGQGTMLGVAFLPMHLPIIFVGLIAGPAVGAIAGAAAPLVSFLLSGMPMLAMLPLMMVELCAYGLVAGLLREVKLPSLAKVVIVQLAGRVVLTRPLRSLCSRSAQARRSPQHGRATWPLVCRDSPCSGR